MKSTLVSVREFARRMKISDTAIHKMFAAGTLPESCKVVPRNGKTYKLDLEKTLAAYHAVGGAPKAEDYEGGTRSNRPAETEIPAAVGGARKAKEISEVFKAKLLQLEYEKEVGKLVEKRAVDMEIFAAGRLIRDRLLEFPDAIIDEILAAADDRAAARLILKDGMTDILRDITKELAKYAPKNEAN